MKTFDITLKNEKERSVRFIILLLVVLHVLFFVYLLLNEQLWKNAVAGLVVTLLYSGYRWLITNTSHQRFSFGSGYFFVIGLIFVNDSWWWFWGMEFTFYILSAAALTPVMLAFSTADVKKTGFPFKKYKWDHFSNVVLKDGLLTLDFKKNKLLQAEIQTPNINEDAFNTFAKEQLNKT